ncbi:MAG: efflux RND transporter periplasmic adaptor subunit [Pseudomonadota bacterium]
MSLLKSYSRRSPRSGLLSRLSPTLLGLGAALLLVLIITGGLHWRAELNAVSEVRPPMPVSALPYTIQDSYRTVASFLGLVETAKSTDLAFEVPGHIERILVEEGQRVREGELMASLDSSALSARRDATLAAMNAAEAQLELAELRVTRQKSLVKKGSVSKAAFDDSRLQAKALRSTLQSSKAQLRSIEIDLEKTSIYAPFDGVVASRFVDEGTVSNSSVPVLRLFATTRLKARIGVSPARGQTLQLGEIYSLQMRGEPIEGKLLAVLPGVDRVTRSAQAVFLLPEDAQALSGEPIQLQLEENRQVSGGWIPLTAMTEGYRGLWSVLRVSEREGATRVLRESVEVLHVDGDMAFVSGTLAHGAYIVSSGINRLSPGSIVRLVEG